MSAMLAKREDVIFMMSNQSGEKLYFLNILYSGSCLH